MLAARRDLATNVLTGALSFRAGYSLFNARQVIFIGGLDELVGSLVVCGDGVLLLPTLLRGLTRSWRAATQRGIQGVVLGHLLRLVGIKHVVVRVLLGKDLWLFVKHTLVVFVPAHLFEEGNVVFDA